MSISLPITSIVIMLANFAVLTIIALAVAYMIMKYIPDITPPIKKYVYTGIVAILVVFNILLPFLGGQYKPKIDIEQVVKPSQVEYNKPKEVIITTPEARTKKLDGFDKDMAF